MHGYLRLFGCASSPVQKLPNEILGLVFTSSAPAEPHDTSNSLRAAVTLSHVCRHWRRLALSRSELWSSIYLHLPLSDAQVDRAGACLLRSRTRPLNVVMDLADLSDDEDEDPHGITQEQMETLCRVLLPHASRWRRIKLVTDDWAPMHLFLRHLISIRSLPLLETVELRRCNEGLALDGAAFSPDTVSLREPVALFDESQTGLEASRALRSLQLFGVHVNWRSLDVRGLREL
ncbi:hypothetical protein PUNSTDRAFT_74789, partial [Punctularia strigosozonata HHB-11173 SS5]|uniref:uncharacterized protein n=1 Tax=Punctularia strigosozonata (strain HHB-11173) TaxID=741275 RepID=UPI000441735E